MNDVEEADGRNSGCSVWEAYKDICSREKLRLSERIEEFARLVKHNGSALAMEMARAAQNTFNSSVVSGN